MTAVARTRIQISTKKTLKEQAEQLFDSLGIDLGTAVNLFLAQSVRDGGLPFRPTTATPFEQSILKTAQEQPIHAGSIDEMKDIINNA
ncbi:type II toxin-antitoxin system RelB/DinJ family antitoxin [Bifidobacterium sp. ESL0745]|uniref:type II toxin-antitoxin system RelB/DinJ family antitoxin n=1 Tax=Bifidobacterium sp. ESL0745 TaxID=2983226 RepID=UPI0023F91DC2|nr:type II toxin-antitoxin system RelB/DinJ family antitoxin [Bifidobacterium sp. ESL0745]MDF7666189.1 type II toxin-antitoxin system RelB/DinJ family antitoxin [Bifidobacterium sp. ESL0745]